MTREEAIEVIKLAMAQVEWDYPMDYAAAFDMAIKALEQEPFINKPCVSSGVCEHDKNEVLDKIRAQIKSNLRGVEIALEVLAENHPLRQKMEGAKDTLEDCLELIDKADKEHE